MNQHVTSSTMNKHQTSSRAKSAQEDLSTRRKREFLNKFLSKTYHMIDQCDPDVASWTDGGDSFTVKDMQSFEKDVLPLYFNHSKFSSFIRQLNFYGFQKLRSDADLQIHTSSIRFAHEYFKSGRLDLLHKIQRNTASKHASVPTASVEKLQLQVEELREQVSSLEDNMDRKVEEVVRTLEKNYTARVQSLEASYESLLATMIQQYKQDIAAPSRRWMTSHLQQVNLADFIRSNQV